MCLWEFIQRTSGKEGEWKQTFQWQSHKATANLLKYSTLCIKWKSISFPSAAAALSYD